MLKHLQNIVPLRIVRSSRKGTDDEKRGSGLHEKSCRTVRCAQETAMPTGLAGKTGYCWADRGNKSRQGGAAIFGRSRVFQEITVQVLIFFSGCVLRCVFCQNRNIAESRAGREITVERLADIFLELQEKKANNINLVKEELKTAGEEINELKESKLQLVEEKEQLQKEIEEKNELLNQYREHLKQAKIESESNRKAILDLQNQLFESQIELVKANKKNPEEIDQDVLQTDMEPEDSPKSSRIIKLKPPVQSWRFLFMVLHFAEKSGYTAHDLNLGILELSRFKIRVLRLQDNDILITVEGFNGCLFIFE